MVRFHAFVLAVSALTLSGCGFKPAASSPASVSGVALRGRAFGGQQPIVGARVYLYEAGTGGYASPATSLLNSATTGTGADYVLTDSSGFFSITGDYTCDTDSPVYVYASGGNAGSGTNSAIGLLAALGVCPAEGNFGAASSTPVSLIWVNEVTTVAAAFALAQYGSDATHIGSPNNGNATYYIQTAITGAAKLSDLATGSALSTLPGVSGSTAPQSTVNTLANILAACVNSSDAAPSHCTTLFGNALSAGSTGTAPTDTAAAILNIAHNPGANVTNLFNLQPGVGSPFVPDLPSAPANFLLQLSTPATVNDPSGMALDNTGDIFLVNHQNSLYKFTQAGLPADGSPFTLPLSGEALALDYVSNVWVCGESHLSTVLSQLSNSGVVQTTDTVSSDGYRLYSIGIDNLSSVWVADNSGTGTLYKYSSMGVSRGSFPGPSDNDGMAIAADGEIWIANYGNLQLAGYSNSGSAVANSPFTMSGRPQNPAFDSSGNLWTPLFNFGHIAKTANGVAASGSPYTVPGELVSSVALDSLGTAWVANTGDVFAAQETYPQYLTHLSSSGAVLQTVTFSANSLQENLGVVAVDGSGNVWEVINNNLYEILGAAGPVVMPIVTNLFPPYAHPASAP